MEILTAGKKVERYLFSHEQQAQLEVDGDAASLTLDAQMLHHYRLPAAAVHRPVCESMQLTAACIICAECQCTCLLHWSF